MTNSSKKLLSLSQAAALAGKSYSWAWERAADGRFATQRTEGGKIQILPGSFASVMKAEKTNRKPLSSSRRTHLRLIVDNTR